MRYLNNRYDFLERYNKVNESTRSGPFENDIPWGDSLLGRLVMATIRKSSIAINVNRIDKLGERLKEQFSYMIDKSGVDFSNDAVVADINKSTIFALLKELKDAVDKEEEIEKLKALTDSTIAEVTNADIDDAKKNALLEDLKNFKEFLKNYDKKDGENVTSEEGTEKSKYPLMIKNLKALSLILSNYKKVNLGVTLKTQPPKPGATTPATTPSTNVATKPNVVSNKPGNVAPAPAPTTKPAPTPVAESIFSYNNFLSLLEADRTNPLGNKPGANIDRNNVTGGEDHLTQAFTKLKKDIEVLISPKEKGISIDAAFVNDLVSKSVNSDTKELIKSLYKEINRYLVGDKKGTIQEKDALYKEGVETLSDKNKLVIVAEKIARFTKRALQFDGQNLYGGIGDLKVPLKDYVDSMKELMKEKSVKPVETSEEGDAEEGGKQTIKEYFYENVDYEPFAIDDAEREKMEKDVQKSDSTTIDYDNVIEVLKLFNRAYKLHTSNVIPGGRSGGAVSRSVYNEYTPFGGNSGTSGTSDGPYRNNKIFDKWEDTVLDILKDKKYQILFDKNTKMRIGDPNGKSVIRENAGGIFRKLITDLLDGEKLYKDGAQEKFLKEYFGGDAYTNGLDNKDKQENAVLATEISDKALKLEFLDNSKLGENESLKNKKYANNFLQFKGKEGDKDKTLYLYVESVSSTTVALSYSIKMHYYDMYINTQDKNVEIKGHADMIGKYKVRYTKMATADFEKMIKNASNIELKGVTVEENNEGETINLTSVVTSWLAKTEDKSLYTITDIDKLNVLRKTIPSEYKSDLANVLKKRGGFEPITKLV